jgi:mRNA-degrading endonuclease toxin of MazEF toxin-antitoxin module
LKRLEVRVATALGKERPVLIVSCDYSCEAQETVVVAPIRTKPPPFPCPGLLKVESLKKRGDVTGFIRLDLVAFYERKNIGPKLIHQFTDADDIELINGTLKAALGL